MGEVSKRLPGVCLDALDRLIQLIYETNGPIIGRNDQQLQIEVCHMLSVIQWAFFGCLGLLGFGIHFGGAWVIIAGLLIAGLLPVLLVLNLFITRR